MPVITAMIADKSLEGAAGVGAGVKKEGACGAGSMMGKEDAWGVFSSGDGVWAQRGIDSGFATWVVMVLGAILGRGAGDSADKQQIGVIGVESASVSMSV